MRFQFLCIITSLFLCSVRANGANADTLPQLQKLVPGTGELVPGFSPGRLVYQVNLKHTISEISFDAAAIDDGTLISINGNSFSTTNTYPLEPGVNSIEIKLQLGGKQNKYVVKVVREHAILAWKKVLSKGPFHIRDSGGELVFNDQMWLFGGYFPELSSDVWSTKDGINWQQHPSIPANGGINIPLNYVYKGKMWIVSNEGELYSSADGNHWDLVNAKPGWGKRYAAGGVVFKNKMWVLGGLQDQSLKNDIWWSEDGVKWTKSSADAPWSPRQLFGNVVVKDNKMWIIGGGITNYAPFKAYRDVWVSEDGIHWKKVTDRAPWPARIWSNCVVYHNRIFLLGGFRSQPEFKNLGDVWYSKDGKEWEELKTDVSWEPRHEHSDYVFKNKLWVVGGNTWPLRNDVWSLEIRGLTFLSQPVLQEFKGAEYKYYAKADFNRSGHQVTYRLRKAPAWLKIDPQAGVVSGIPDQPGNFEVVVEAYDTAGEAAVQQFVIQVE